MGTEYSRYTVDWPVDGENWKETSQEIKDYTGISRYKLYESNGIDSVLYRYTLWIETTKTKDCRFIDDSGDSYSLSVNSCGQHY
ncbi:hypothetical protein BGZ49_002765, partial [Haplosporangium sp. Z 27]